MIRSFASKAAEAIFNDQQSPELPSTIQNTARRKLVQIDLAQSPNDLRVPPGNHLEALKANRKGQHAIRINVQWRICLKWTPNGVEDTEIADYH
jgi:proteic killer suppression protein